MTTDLERTCKHLQYLGCFCESVGLLEQRLCGDGEILQLDNFFCKCVVAKDWMWFFMCTDKGRPR